MNKRQNWGEAFLVNHCVHDSSTKGVTGLLVLHSAEGYATAADITYKVSIYIIII